MIRKARQEGADSVGEREAENPYDHNGLELEAILSDSWEEGRESAEEQMADEYAQFCDSSMRDLYE